MRDIESAPDAAGATPIPVAEYDPLECVSTNLVGGEDVVDAAVRGGARCAAPALIRAVRSRRPA